MILRQEDRQARRAAFTLMEMLIVVAIIVALAGIGGVYLFGALESSQESTAQSQAKGPLTQAVGTYFINHNQWPQSLDILLQKDELGKGPYLESPDALIDPWKQRYQYDPSGPMNGGMKPDIWAVSPKTGQKFGNWATSVNR